MGFELKESTASQELVFGPFVDDTDGVTPETGLTIANTDVRIWKEGGTTFANKNSGGLTHIEDGYYYGTFDATDSNTVGDIFVQVTMSGALPVWREGRVLDAVEFDSKRGNDYKQVDVIQIEGSDATDQINAACDTALTDYDAVVPADLPTNFADLSITATTGRVDVAAVAGTAQTANDNGADINAILADTNELQTDNIPGTLTTIEGKIDTIDGIVDSILVDTGEIGAAGAGLTAVPWNASWDAEVQSECADALAAYDPPTKAELDSGLAGLNDITAADVWDSSSASLSLSFESIMDRLYRFLMNKMNITDATGSVALRNDGDSADLATQTITDDDTTTTRTALSWV